MRAGVVLVVAGIALAAVLGFAAHVVAQDTIGLPAVSLKGGRPLAPEDAKQPKKKPKQTKTTTEPAETGESGASGPRTATVDDHGGSTSGSSGPGSGESGDDSGGHGRNRGSGGGGSDD